MTLLRYELLFWFVICSEGMESNTSHHMISLWCIFMFSYWFFCLFSTFLSHLTDLTHAMLSFGRNPLYLGVIFVGFLLVKALWVQLDISGEFRNGAVSKPYVFFSSVQTAFLYNPSSPFLFTMVKRSYRAGYFWIERKICLDSKGPFLLVCVGHKP